jgi:pantothenate kinase type III
MPDCILLLDHGNTRLKYRFADLSGNVLYGGMVLNEKLPSDFPEYDLRPSAIVMARSGPDTFAPEEIWPGVKLFVPAPEDFKGISWAYTFPGQLGRDRMAAMLGAAVLFPDKNLVIADAGTCLTADYLGSDGTHLGGFISPGYRMRLMAMHTFTGSLPLVPDSIPARPAPGNSTETCMSSGAFGGLLAELDFYFTAEIFHPGKADVFILSGGDAKDLAHHLKQSTFVADDLIFRGLYQAYAGRFL